MQNFLIFNRRLHFSVYAWRNIQFVIIYYFNLIHPSIGLEPRCVLTSL